MLHKNIKNTQKRNIKNKQNKDNKYNDIQTKYKLINSFIHLFMYSLYSLSLGRSVASSKDSSPQSAI
jgi:hypothetical protein